MVAYGMMEILFLFASAGAVQADLLSLIRAEDYFAHHKVEVSVTTMLEQAGKAPSDGPSQAAQLLAIRWLGEQKEHAKNEKVRALLGRIAAGTQGRDAQGFAREYASRALARLDGKPLPVKPLPAGSLRADGLAWFPEDTTLAGGIDVRGPGPIQLDGRLPLQLLGMVGGREREELIKVADQLGNVELERTTFAYAEDGKDATRDRIWIRLTGRGDRKRLVEFTKTKVLNAMVVEEKGPKDEPITIVHSKGHPPAFAFVGDHDVVMGGFEGSEGEHLSVVRDVLEVMAARKPGIGKSKVASYLKDVPADVSVLLAGNLNERQRRAMARLPGPVAAPSGLTLMLIRNENLTVRMRCRMADADEAKKLVEQLTRLKKDANELVDRLPPPPEVPKELAEQMRKAIAGIKVSADDKVVLGAMVIPGSALKPVPELLRKALGKGG